MQEIVVKPSIGRTVLLAALCLGFTLMGVWMIASGGWFNILLGAVAIAFFGVGGAVAFLKQRRQGMTFTLTPEGIVVGSGGRVPWANIARIGATKVGTAARGMGGAAALGIQLRDVRAFVSTLTPQQQLAAVRAARIGRTTGPALGALGGRGVGSDLSTIPTDDVAAAVRWAAERSGGYHVTFPLLNLNKPVDQTIAQIESYRAQATGRR